MTNDTERTKRYGKAIWEASRADEGTISVTGADVVARAVMSVVDAEQAELRAEVARLTRGGRATARCWRNECQTADWCPHVRRAGVSS